MLEGSVDISNFHVMNTTRLAPIVRNNPDKAKKRIDSLDMPSGPDGLYLALLKTDYVPGKQTRTWPQEKRLRSSKDDEEVKKVESTDGDESLPVGVITPLAVGESNSVNGKMPRSKLVQFHKNQRHSFWGLSTKKRTISGRYGYFFIVSLFL